VVTAVAAAGCGMFMKNTPRPGRRTTAVESPSG